MKIFYGAVEQTLELRVRPLSDAEGLLRGPDQIAGYLFGNMGMGAQVERLILEGELPYFRLNGVPHATKSSLQRFADRTFGRRRIVHVYLRGQQRAHFNHRQRPQRPSGDTTKMLGRGETSL